MFTLIEYMLIDKNSLFLELIKNPSYYFYMKLTKVFNIYQNIIQIYNDKNIKVFNKNLINVIL